MNQPIQDYASLGLVHFMLYKDTIKGEGDFSSVSTILDDPYFGAMEMSWVNDDAERAKVAGLVKKSGKKVAFGAQPVLLTQKLDINHLDEAERKKAVDAVLGTVKVRGEAVRVRGIRDLMKRGFAYVPEDRKTQGLFLGMTVRENITISVIRRVFKTIFISIKRLVGLAEDYVESLDIETPGVEQTVRNLSGGNQQKVIIARGLTLKPRVFVMDEPTRGIDVGAKAEIHGLMDRLAGDGVGMIMISS